MNFEYVLPRTELMSGKGVLENIEDRVSKSRHKLQMGEKNDISSPTSSN